MIGPTAAFRKDTHTEKCDRVDLILLAVVLAVGVLLFLNAEGKLLHPLVDAGREIYIPQQISQGADLYEDFSYYYPPLAPYLLSIPAGLTEWHLFHVSAVGVTISLLVLGLLFLIARQFMSRGAAATVSFLFVCVNFTGAYTFGSNFIFPYSYGAVLGILFFLSGTYWVIRGIYKNGSSINWWCAVLFFMVAGWSKLELAFFGLLMILTASTVYLVQRSQGYGTTFRRLLLTAGLAVLSLILANQLFPTEPGVHWLFSQVLSPALLKGAEAKRFYSTVTGSFMWRFNLTAAAQGAGLTLVYIGIVHRLDRLTHNRKARAGIGQVSEAILLIGLLGIVTMLLTRDNFLFFRGWSLLQPLTLMAMLFTFVRQYRRQLQPTRETLQLLVLLVGSMAVTSRIYLHISPRWYGFWMTLPLYLLIAHILFVTLPNMHVYRRRSTLLWAPLVITVCLNGVTDQLTNYAQKIFPVITPKGTFYLQDPHQAAVLNIVLRHLRELGVDELVVMPEGLTVNYLADIVHPLWYHTFSPMEIGEPEIEADVLRNIQAKEPQWILVSNFAYKAWGGEGFGRGYAVQIAEYLREEYMLEKEWHSPTLKFSLLRRAE